MKKSKFKEVDLLYSNKNDKKKKKVVEKNKSTTKKNMENGQADNESFNIDNEIVIGITKKEDENKKKKKEVKKKKENKEVKSEKPKKEKQKNKPEKKKRRKSFRIAKYTILLLIIIGSIIYFLLSPVFNLKVITINNNNKISRDEIISLSGIKTDENLFKIRSRDVEKNIKENPYVESVKISKKLPSEVIIEIEERTPTFMLEFVNSYVYINNQGYMLEVSEEKLKLPVITGLATSIDEYKPGNRLIKEDLQKLETVLKIMDAANSYELGELITSINIADKNNFVLYLETEQKTVYLGNASNINTRIMYLKEILIKEKGIESEIFINKDINKGDVYTREKV